MDKLMIETSASRAVDIDFVNISYTVRSRFQKHRKQILKGVSGRFKSGELTAIMGPSGAGKTSLFHILTGFRRDNVDGDINYIGFDGSPISYDEYRKVSRYIQQEDKLYPTFTVIEIMRIAADLKLPQDIAESDKRIVIENTLKTFDLSRVKGVRCDRLSGGQRKRLCIAVELVDNPKVVFLDEPTTGLDSSLTAECITTLKTLAKDQRTIVCVIHQPSAAIYEAFDQVYFLAEGRCVYHGLPQDTVPYFRDFGLCCPLYHNPADYVTEVISNEYGYFIKDLENAVLVNLEVADIPKMANKKIHHYNRCGGTDICVFEFDKFSVLVNRCITQLFRDWSAVQMKIGLHILIGLLLGTMFLSSGKDGSKTLDNVRFILCSSVFLSYTTLIPAVLRFPLELPVLQKEHFNNWYHLRTYFAAVSTVNIPFQVILASVYCAIAYALTGQPMELDRFMMFVMVGTLTGLTAESFGFLFGSVFNPINGTFIGACTLATMLSLAGVLPLFQHMPEFMYALSYLSFLRYSMEAMMIAVYGFDREKINCPPTEDYCYFIYPKELLNELYMTESRFWPNVIALLVYFAVIRVLAFGALKRRLGTA